MRIIELLVDEADYQDQFIGIDGIALVKRPAHEETWMAFTENKPLKQPHEVLTEEEMYQLGEALAELGETHEDIIADGYILESVKRIDNKKSFVGDINSYPNDESVEDYAGIRVRYRYVGGRPIATSRDFCVAMLRANKVYRIEDIERMTATQANDEFGYYDIFQWRGSYNCRHYWVQLTYKAVNPKENVSQGKILNNGKRTENLIGESELPQESTETKATANNKRIRLSTDDFNLVDIIDNQPLFDNREDAELVANLMGCKGVHIHDINGKDHYMPCEKHQQMADTYEVPKYVQDIACKARRYKEDNPKTSCGTRVGWIRSSQLCGGEKISRETIARMSAFARHLANAEKQSSYDDGCALLMVDAWGGKAGIEWAQKELERIDSEKLSYDVTSLPSYKNQTGETISESVAMEGLEDACWPGYEAIGTKIKNGREVPNCVPKSKMTKSLFNINDDKMEITGAALVPNKMIIRHNAVGEPYYVYFSESTVKKLSDKFMKDKLMDSTNIEHTNKKAKDTYVIESWIVADDFDDKSNALGLDYEKGTWVITMKTDDPEVWADIKNGKYKGFSVEGYFEEKQIFNEDDHILNGIKTLIKSIKDDK